MPKEKKDKHVHSESTAIIPASASADQPLMLLSVSPTKKNYGFRKKTLKAIKKRTNSGNQKADVLDAVTLQERLQEAFGYIAACQYDAFKTLLEHNRSLAQLSSEKGEQTLLHRAAGDGNLQMVELLVKYGANINATDKSGRTPLIEAVQSKISIPVIEFLLKNNADLSIHSLRRTTALYYATRGIEDNTELTKLLLKYTSKHSMLTLNFLIVDQPPFKTVLDYAQHPTIRAMLIKKGAISGEEYLHRIKNETQLSLVGKTLRTNGFKPKHPIILLPGTCSSSLELWDTPKSNWRGGRIWLDPIKMGLRLGLKNKQAEDIAFLEHMRLGDDGISDPPGIKARPPEGIHGIDYLIDHGPNAIIKQSVVWGEVINMFATLGYDSSNLIGFPYDWRLGPVALEMRDKLFTKLKYQCELLLLINKQKVALIGHSQGCKFGQYFLHWAEHHCGKEWIDEHIEMLLALGPPWAGAPKIVRALLAGDSMGLPTQILFGNRFLVAMSRTYSGTHWLLPFGTLEKCLFVNEDGQYTRTKWNEILPDNCENYSRFMKDYYDNSLLFGKQEAGGDPRALQAPHVKAIHCIYGVNAKELPNFQGEIGTEIGAYYDPRSNPVQIGNKVIKFRVAKKINHDHPGLHYFVTNGVMKERPIETRPSGDGTVPYESLSWAERWKDQPGAPTIKTYEFNGVCHRETLLEPAVLALIGELVCGGNPKEVSASEKRAETIFDKTLKYVLMNLSDDQGIPYIVSCIITSLRATNSVSLVGICNTPGIKSDVDQYGAFFTTYKSPTCLELNGVYPHSRVAILVTFLEKLDEPIIDFKHSEQLLEMKIWATKEDVIEMTVVEAEAIVEVLTETKRLPFILLILSFCYEVYIHPVNEATLEFVSSVFVNGLFWFEVTEAYKFENILKILMQNYLLIKEVAQQELTSEPSTILLQHSV